MRPPRRQPRPRPSGAFRWETPWSAYAPLPPRWAAACALWLWPEPLRRHRKSSISNKKGGGVGARGWGLPAQPWWPGSVHHDSPHPPESVLSRPPTQRVWIGSSLFGGLVVGLVADSGCHLVAERGKVPSRGLGPVDELNHCNHRKQAVARGGSPRCTTTPKATSPSCHTGRPGRLPVPRLRVRTALCD